MRLSEFISKRFSSGIDYEDAVNLCLAIYSQSGLLPIALKKDELSIEGIAKEFAFLAGNKLVKNYSPYKAVLYGAHYHAIEDKGHWIEIQASIFKLGVSYNIESIRSNLVKS